MPRRLYYCDHHSIPLPPGHKFPIEKYAMLRARLEAERCFELQPAPFAEARELELAHDEQYVRAILSGDVDPRVMRRIGFPWSEQLVRRTLASVGGTLAASRDAIASGLGGNLAGGTHHAFRGEGSGFCVFNDLAVAIFTLRQEGLAARAAVVDLDVHQGDGTAAIFENDPSVLTISIHGENNFPFRKQRSRIDIGLPDGTGDEEYLDYVRKTLPAVLAFKPEVIFYQAGVDGLASDRLGRLALTHEGLGQRDRLVLETAIVHHIPIVITLGGGYSAPIEATAEAHADTFRIAAQIYKCMY
jgi:acetoin utilization deacetylase AcuC-like enzyme